MENQEFTKNGITIEFYQKEENDQKFSFKIKEDPELTEILLANVKTKQVKEKDIKYTVKGIFDILKQKEDLILPSEFNKREILTEYCTKKFGKTYEKEVLTNNHLHQEMKITLPDGSFFIGQGFNQKIATENAAKNAIKHLNINI